MPTHFELAAPCDIRFGAGGAAQVPAVLAELGVRRALVVTGATPARADLVRARLAAAGVPSEVFAVPGEPSVELVRAGVAALRAAGCDGVLGYGGGSALDAAKAVAVLAASGSDPLEHLEVIGAGRPLSRATLGRDALPCVAVPTTAGTGSEVTRNAVLSSGEVKASLRSPLLLPRAAIVDPDLLVGLSRPTIAASGMDALSQLIEPFLCRRANPFTDALAREGIRRSARSLRRGGQGGLDADPQARDDLALASLFGGLCLANSGLGAVHGFAAVLGARLQAPHGVICGVLLPITLKANWRALTRRAPGHPALERFGEIAVLLTGHPNATPDDAVSWLGSLAEDLQLPRLASFGADEADLPALVAAARSASSMRANPIDLDDDELTSILARAL